jgi:hypothetical protein
VGGGCINCGRGWAAQPPMMCEAEQRSCPGRAVFWEATFDDGRQLFCECVCRASATSPAYGLVIIQRAEDKKVRRGSTRWVRAWEGKRKPANPSCPRPRVLPR